MKISINNGDSAVYTGYGHATLKLMANLAKTRHSVVMNRPCEFEMTFSHPQNYVFLNPDSYKIGYTAWESTDIPEDWHEGLAKIDELWVPNQFTKDSLSSHTDKPIYVFKHGLDPIYEPRKRTYDGVLRFLHVGYPAVRKNLPDVVNAFLELYKGREDVHLTIKAYENCEIPFINEPNITVIAKTYSTTQMIDLLHSHHVMVYPSWGEGFGLIPLQALGSGMPAIVTEGWCDYSEYMPDLMIKSKLSYSPWLTYHPGKMFKPDFEHLKELMLYCENNIKFLLERHFNISKQIHEEWNWEKVVSEHFDGVEARLVV
jgi:glycosyltransferase involved in cell wall biosynthesis